MAKSLKILITTNVSILTSHVWYKQTYNRPGIVNDDRHRSSKGLMGVHGQAQPFMAATVIRYCGDLITLLGGDIVKEVFVDEHFLQTCGGCAVIF